jgi:hypothetical protein
MVVAITTWTTEAPAAPNYTKRGPPRVDMTSESNWVLSGSPRKMIGKTAGTTVKFTAPSVGPRALLRSSHNDTASQRSQGQLGHQDLSLDLEVDFKV